MKEQLLIPNVRDIGDVRGFVTLDYTDPITGKIKEQIKGENHVYRDSFFCGNNGDWRQAVSDCTLVLTNSDYPIDPNFPYILGTMRGFGLPNQGSTGLYRGLYQPATSFLNRQSLDGVSWKFVYDWTASQALGDISTVGLTKQYFARDDLHFSRYRPEQPLVQYYISDGRYAWSFGSPAVINAPMTLIRFDMYTGSTKTIDLLGITETQDPYLGGVGFDYKNGKSYVKDYRQMRIYEFNNLEFEGTPQWGRCNSNGSGNYSFFTVRNGVEYVCANAANVPFRKCALTIGDPTTLNPLIDIPLPPASTFPAVNQLTTAGTNFIVLDKFLIAGNSTGSSGCVILDLDRAEYCGEVYSHGTSSGASAWFLNPISEHKLPARAQFQRYLTAITQYKLPNDAPTRPPGTGMTVTYEIVVDW